MPNYYCGFGGVPIESLDGESLEGVSGQTTQFIYDGDGNLVKKIKPGGSKTIYVGGIYEVDKASGGSVTSTTTYYPASGAMRVDGTLYFVLSTSRKRDTRLKLSDLRRAAQTFNCTTEQERQAAQG